VSRATRDPVPSGPGVAARLRHPGQVTAIGFATAILVGTGLLSLPAATADGSRTHIVDALFTATSAVCITGLITVDTGGHWSTFGEVVILVLIQLGGLGIMTMATLLTVLLSRRLGLRAQLVAQAETKTLQLQDVRRVVRNVVLFSLVSEAVVAVILTARLASTYDRSFAAATYEGVFHAISAFNSAGFSLYSDSLQQFVTDPWISLTVATAFIIGGLGFPVVFELVRSGRRPREWSILTKVTLYMTIPLLVIGTAVLGLSEYTNQKTLGALSGFDKLVAAFFAAATPRSSGFSTIDVSQMRPDSWLFTDLLMFIGGGSASTAGGIKVTTFGLLAFVLWAELRGEPRVNIGRRRVPEHTQRQALAILMLSVSLLSVSTFVMLELAPQGLDRVFFEVMSASATVGLSTGITADLPRAGQILLVLLMFVGRIGPLTLFSALALRERARRYELPEERMIIG
jgi:trk system potassium uptake protein TrkH